MSSITSNAAAKFGKYDFNKLPKEMHGMKIKDDKSDDKVMLSFDIAILRS